MHPSQQHSHTLLDTLCVSIKSNQLTANQAIVESSYNTTHSSLHEFVHKICFLYLRRYPPLSWRPPFPKRQLRAGENEAWLGCYYNKLLLWRLTIVKLIQVWLFVGLTRTGCKIWAEREHVIEKSSVVEELPEQCQSVWLRDERRFCFVSFEKLVDDIRWHLKKRKSMN